MFSYATGVRELILRYCIDTAQVTKPAYPWLTAQNRARKGQARLVRLVEQEEVIGSPEHPLMCDGSKADRIINTATGPVHFRFLSSTNNPSVSLAKCIKNIIMIISVKAKANSPYI